MEADTLDTSHGSRTGMRDMEIRKSCFDNGQGSRLNLEYDLSSRRGNEIMRFTNYRETWACNIHIRGLRPKAKLSATEVRKLLQ